MEWIVIVNRIGAKIYNWEDEGKRLKLCFSLPNPLGRLKNRMLRWDEPGRRHSRLMTSPAHRLTRERNPHEEAVDQFIKEVVQTLRKKMVLNPDLFLRVVAEARLLGKIRGGFPSNLRHRVAWVKKDLAKIPEIKWARLIGLESRLPATQWIN